MSTLDVYVGRPGERAEERVRMRLDTDLPLRFHSSEAAANGGRSGGTAVGAPGAHPGYIALARRLADDTVERLLAIDGRFFDRWLAKHDLANAYRFVLTLRLAVHVLPGLIRFLSTRDGTGNTVVADTGLCAEQLRMVEQHVGVEVPAAGIVTTVHPRLVQKLKVLLTTGDPARVGAAHRVEDLSAAAGIIVCGAGSEVERLGALASLLRRRGGTIVLAKSDADGTVQAAEAVARAGAGTVVTAGSFASLRPDDLDRLGNAMTKLEAAIAPVRVEEREFALTHLDGVLKLGRAGAAWERLAKMVRPRIVAGAFDRSAYGPICSRFGAERPYRLVDFQHGILRPMGVLDVVDFDLLLSMNECAAEVIRLEAGTRRHRIAVVGDPALERRRRPRRRPPRRGTAGELVRWKGGSALLVVFPKPVRGALLSSASVHALHAWVRDAVAADERLKVLIKRRFLTVPPEEEKLFDDLIAAGRARTASAEDVSVADALAAADASVSIISTTLLESLAAGVPAISVDPDGITSLFAMGHDLLVCRSSAELRRAIESVLATRGRPASAPDLVPRLRGSYRRRLRRVLAEADALPPRRRRPLRS